MGKTQRILKKRLSIAAREYIRKWGMKHVTNIKHNRIYKHWGTISITNYYAYPKLLHAYTTLSYTYPTRVTKN